MAKIQAFIFVKVCIRDKGTEEKADDDQAKNQITLITKIYCLKNLNVNLNIHGMIHHI